MSARIGGQLSSVRNGGREVQKIPRLVFRGDYLRGRERYPDAVGYVNFRHKAYPVFRDASKKLYLRVTDRPLGPTYMTRGFR